MIHEKLQEHKEKEKARSCTYIRTDRPAKMLMVGLGERPLILLTTAEML
jgi:hypothetical protein